MAIHDNYHHDNDNLNMTKSMMTLIIIPVLPGAGCTFVFEQRSILAEPAKISTSTLTLHLTTFNTKITFNNCQHPPYI